MASTALPPLNAICARPGQKGAWTVWYVVPRPRVTCAVATLPDGCATVQMLPLGARVASSRSPKLGPGEASSSADSFPPPWDVAMAISAPSGPDSEATVSCIHTRVTRFDLLTRTQSPAALEVPMESPAAAMVWIPPAQRVAPRGSVHRLTMRPEPVLPIQPM